MYFINEVTVDYGDSKIAAKVIIKEGVDGDTEIHFLDDAEYLKLKEEIEKISQSTVTEESLLRLINDQYKPEQDKGVNALWLGNRRFSEYSLVGHTHDDLKDMITEVELKAHEKTTAKPKDPGHVEVPLKLEPEVQYPTHAVTSAQQGQEIKMSQEEMQRKVAEIVAQMEQTDKKIDNIESDGDINQIKQDIIDLKNKIISAKNDAQRLVSGVKQASKLVEHNGVGDYGILGKDLIRSAEYLNTQMTFFASGGEFQETYTGSADVFLFGLDYNWEYWGKRIGKWTTYFSNGIGHVFLSDVQKQLEDYYETDDPDSIYGHYVIMIAINHNYGHAHLYAWRPHETTK